MTLFDRATNALAGFALLDLLQIPAALECSRRSLPKGSLWLAAETQRNLQHCALGLISFCLGKNPQGNPWTPGDHRLSELPVEMFFGRLRTQSSSAQLTAKSYWTAGSRDAMREHMKQKRRGDPDVTSEVLEPLTADAFHEASHKGFRAALELAAWVADVNVKFLEETYIEWCQGGKFGVAEALLGDEDWDNMGQMEEGAADEDAAAFLEHLQTEASIDKDLDEEPGEEPKSPLVLSLGKVPDKDLVQVILTAQEKDSDFQPDQHEPDGSSVFATNLYTALWQCGSDAADEEKLDSVWRLLMYLRHWKAGADRTWIANPRMCRKRSHALNWHQCLGFGL